ncbi:MAG: hypothetical protein DRP58_02775 [Spirochaetes bacterium]|nr:MAG: hypothetical protein DRP58_02775 [Spirochaetota bacterium]
MARLYIRKPLSKKKSESAILETNMKDFAVDLNKLSKYGISLAAVIGNLSSPNGVFPKAMMGKTKALVKSTIINQGKGKDTANVNWKPLNDVYVKWKKDKQPGQFHSRIWFLGGKVLQSTVVRREGSRWVVGLNKKITTPKLQYGRIDQRTGKGDSISVEEYASYIEYGSAFNKHPRPLFNPSMLKASQEYFPELVDCTQESINKAILIFEPRLDSAHSKTDTAQASDLISSSTLKSAGGYTEAHVADVLITNHAQGGYQIVNQYEDNTKNNAFKRNQKKSIDKLLSSVSDPTERAKIKAFSLSNKEEY